MRKVVIAGGSGWLGQALAAEVVARGDQAVVLTRGTSVPIGRAVSWNPSSFALRPWAEEIDGADAVVNLAGELIAGARWTASRKRALTSSRIQPTSRLVDAILAAAAPPPVFVSASGVGYYGARGDATVTEADGPGSDFLAELCAQWEAEAERAGRHTRVVVLRTAPVLEQGGGMLAPMLLPFKLGAGGPVGSGRQVLALDSSGRLGQPGALGDRDAGRQGPAQRGGAQSGHEPRLHARARPGSAPAGGAADTGVRAPAHVRRNGRRRAPLGAARRTGGGRAPRVCVSLSPPRPGAGRDLQPITPAIPGTTDEPQRHGDAQSVTCLAPSLAA